MFYAKVFNPWKLILRVFHVNAKWWRMKSIIFSVFCCLNPLITSCEKICTCEKSSPSSSLGRAEDKWIGGKTKNRENLFNITQEQSFLLRLLFSKVHLPEKCKRFNWLIDDWGIKCVSKVSKNESWFLIMLKGKMTNEKWKYPLCLKSQLYLIYVFIQGILLCYQIWYFW